MKLANQSEMNDMSSKLLQVVFLLLLLVEIALLSVYLFYRISLNTRKNVGIQKVTKL